MTGKLNIGFTGTSSGMTLPQLHSVESLLAKYALSVHHGDCVGADAEAHSLAIELNIPVFLHPPDNPKKRAFCEGAAYVSDPKPYLVRDRDIVGATQMLIAAPAQTQEVLRSGTWATIRYARQRRISVFIVTPNGNVVEEHP